MIQAFRWFEQKSEVWVALFCISSLFHSVFEDALATAGWDWHSDRLWDLYAEWEKEQGDLKAMTAVYDRAIRVPTQLYRTHYEK